METTANKRIAEFIKENTTSADKVTEQLISLLEKVDAAIQEKYEAVEEAKQAARQTSFSVSSIAKAAHIARKTCYNNPLLLKYISLYGKPPDETTVSAKEIENLKKEIKKRDRKIKDMVRRDLESEKLRQELKEVRAELETSKKLTEDTEERYEKLIAEYNELKRQLPSNVVPFDKPESKGGGE